MDIPTRNEIRQWFYGLSREDIKRNIEAVKAEHGELIAEDVRFYLNQERELVVKKQGHAA